MHKYLKQLIDGFATFNDGQLIDLLNKRKKQYEIKQLSALSSFQISDDAGLAGKLDKVILECYRRRLTGPNGKPSLLTDDELQQNVIVGLKHSYSEYPIGSGLSNPPYVNGEGCWQDQVVFSTQYVPQPFEFLSKAGI